METTIEKKKILWFKPETITDGMTLGIIKERMGQKGIPCKLTMSCDTDTGGLELNKIGISTIDLLALLCHHSNNNLC